MIARLVTVADMLAAEIGHREQSRTHDLLARCLRLEARIGTLERERAKAWPMRPARRAHFKVTPADITTMRTLRAQGMALEDIAMQLRWSYPTVRRYTLGVLEKAS